MFFHRCYACRFAHQVDFSSQASEWLGKIVGEPVRQRDYGASVSGNAGGDSVTGSSTGGSGISRRFSAPFTFTM